MWFITDEFTAGVNKSQSRHQTEPTAADPWFRGQHMQYEWREGNYEWKTHCGHHRTAQFREKRYAPHLASVKDGIWQDNPNIQ